MNMSITSVKHQFSIKLADHTIKQWVHEPQVRNAFAMLVFDHYMCERVKPPPRLCGEMQDLISKNVDAGPKGLIDDCFEIDHTKKK